MLKHRDSAGAPDLRRHWARTPRKAPAETAVSAALFLLVLASLMLPAQAPAQSSRKASRSQVQAHEPLAPQPVDYEEASSGKFSDKLVSISGVLVSQLQDADSYTVILNTQDHLIGAVLDRSVPMPQYEPGSTLRIAGICRVVPANSNRAAHLAYIELHRAEDVQLISKPSWLTLGHVLVILCVFLVIGLVLAVRAAFINWQAANRNAWIGRSMIVARERSRILERISSNHSLEELLGEICKSTMELLPGVECSYHLEPQPESGQQSKAEAKGEAGKDNPAPSRQKTIFEVALRDDMDRVTGMVVVTADPGQALAADRQEIFNLLSELTALAMRQSLLYRGLVYHSTHDPLTELPNRRLCESRLAAALKHAEQSGGQLAVIYIDINRFKYVNDKYGHKAGDLYLQQISNRLRAQLRPIDMLARVGGDEFVVVAPFPEAFDRAHALTARLQACFDEPFNLDGESIDGSASFGFARYPEHGLTAEELTRHADHQMYISKHESHISEGAHAIAIITSDELELALLNRAFRLAYQPQFSAAGHLTGLEALIRLEDPVLGLITPDAFISVAERHSVIVDIGTWALRRALQDASQWRLNQGEPVSLAVNVSVRQLEEPGYAKTVLAALKEYEFPAERLEIELIERSLMFSGDKVLQQLVQLREAGVRISLDDFGTEQSCLSLLHKLPIDTIKLDRSFIRAMDDEPTVLPIIQAIVSMAQSLGKRIVAEAIEHVGPVPELLKMGKMDFQGYLLSRPIPAEQVESLIHYWRSGIVMPDAFREINHGRLIQG